MMPLNLVLVRHGRSEGNEANARSRQGDHSAFTTDFLNRSSRTWRLTNQGIEQAQAAGEWLRQEFPNGFGRYYVSEYLRAMETAAHLELPKASWYLEPDLRERDRGAMDVMSQEQAEAEYAEVLRRRDIDTFLWCPPGGESIAQMRGTRIRNHFGTLARECSNMDVVEVEHGEVMWTKLMLNTRMTILEFFRLDASKNPKDHIHNGQILHFTRVNPRTGIKETSLNWMRWVCPWDLKRSRNRWQKIIRPKFSNQDLLDYVNKQQRMIC